MPFLDSTKLPAGDATRRNFRGYRRIYRKLACNGKVYVYNGTGSTQFCPFLGASGIRINNDTIALTELRNPVSYAKRIKLYNQMRAASGITVGTQAEAEAAQLAVHTASSKTVTDMTQAFTFKTPDVAGSLKIKITATADVSLTCGTLTLALAPSATEVLEAVRNTTYTFTPGTAAASASITLETSVAINATTATDSLIIPTLVTAVETPSGSTSTSITIPAAYTAAPVISVSVVGDTAEGAAPTIALTSVTGTDESAVTVDVATATGTVVCKGTAGATYTFSYGSSVADIANVTYTLGYDVKGLTTTVDLDTAPVSAT